MEKNMEMKWKLALYRGSGIWGFRVSGLGVWGVRVWVKSFVGLGV